MGIVIGFRPHQPLVFANPKSGKLFCCCSCCCCWEKKKRDMAMADYAKVGGYAGFRGSRTVFPENHSLVPVSIKRWSLVQADKRAVFSSLVFSRVANDTSRDSDFKTLIGAFRLKAAPTTMWQLSEEDADSSDNFVQETEKELHVSTQLLQLDNSFDPYSAVSTPLYQTATFKQPSATDCGPYDYTRSGNPTRDVLERLLAKLEGADQAFCFTTGMSALSTITHLAKAGQEIVAGDDIYGGSDRLLSQVCPKSGLVVKRIDTGNLDEVRAAVGPSTKIVWIESPTNPRQMISDIREIAKIAHEYGALLVVDNSIMSPVLSKPLDLGADIVMHSATKFIAGHSDVMAGVLAVKGESLAKEIYFLQNAEGSGLAPFDCWLCLRGVKTMVLRVEKQQANAQKIAEFLASHPRIPRVNYAGLPGHTGRSLHFSQCKGAGSVLSFNTGSLAVSKHIAESTKLFSITVSFGSVKSLISLPCFMSHASIPSEVREARGLTEDLIRLSIGIEDVDDLIADLDQALQTAPY